MQDCRTGGETTNVDVQWLQDLQETNRNVGTISVGELVRIIKTVMCPTVKRIEAVENDVAALRQDITTQKNEISTLNNVLKEHQKSLKTLCRNKKKREKYNCVWGNMRRK